MNEVVEALHAEALQLAASVTADLEAERFSPLLLRSAVARLDTRVNALIVAMAAADRLERSRKDN